MYEYRALVRRVYDGDTITVDIDLGFNIVTRNQKIRLVGINAPEIRGKLREKGLESRDFLRKKILGKWIVLKTSKDKKGKFGRWLGSIFIENENINSLMIKEGFAKKYEWFKYF